MLTFLIKQHHQRREENNILNSILRDHKSATEDAFAYFIKITIKLMICLLFC